MRIALYTNTLALGGIPKVMLNMGIALKACGCEVEVVLNRMEGEHLSQFKKEGLRLIGLNAPKANAPAIGSLRNYLEKRRPDAVIAYGAFFNAYCLLARLIMKGPKPVVLATDHGVLRMENLNPSNALWKKLLLLFLYRAVLLFIYPLADAIITLSGHHQRSIEKLLLPWIKTIPIQNPVVTEEMLRQSKKKVPIPPGKVPLLIAAGRLHPSKNHRMLIEAFAEVRKSHKAKLLLLGNGPEEAYIKEKVRAQGLQKDVHLLGYKPNPYAYMAKGKLFILSSNRDAEALPTVLVEALACGCPVVSTRCTGSEILEEGRYGTIVPTGDPKAMAHAITHVLDHYEEATHKMKSFQKVRLADYTPTSVATRYLSLIEEKKKRQPRP